MTARKRKQLVGMFTISVLGAILLITHGILLDLDMSQVRRLTLGGFLVTLPCVFVALLILEWIFDLA